MSNDELARLRGKLDKLDEQLIEVLAERWQLAKEIGKLKHQNAGTAIIDPARESEVLRRALKIAGDRLPTDFVKLLYREIFSGSVACQSPPQICYLGPEGSFSHEAAQKTFGQFASYQAEPSIRACIDTVEHRRADYAVVPYENSTEGGVGDTLDNLVETELVACRETMLRIHHNLLAAPGEFDKEAVTKLYSHPQSFAQCRHWLNANLPHCVRIECSSNSAAVQQAAANGAAAIGPAGVAQRYGFQIQVRNIEDNPHNITRFLSLGSVATRPTGDDRCSLILVLQDEPGALHKVLQQFAEAGVNMSRLESRPMPGAAFAQYMFFIDAQGHCEAPPLKALLVNLRKTVSFLKVLGAYPRSTGND